MKKIEAIQILQKSNRKLFSLSDIKKLLKTASDNTAYKQVAGLIEAGVLKRVSKGIYLLTSNKPTDFELANFLYKPSYVSLDSALNYYGILVQSPQQIISVTPNLTKKIEAGGKDFVYMHLNQKYYSDYQQVDGFLIATPEKALIDALFFVALGRGSLSTEELILDSVNKNKLKDLAEKIDNRAFKKYFKSLKL